MIYIIGLGMEGISSLSQRALTLIEGAHILAGGKRHLAAFPEFNGKKVAIGSNLYDVLKVLNLKPQIPNPKPVVVLATGDPNFFGIADFMIEKFGKDAVEIIPNVSSMQTAFARIKENWNDARFLSAHGRKKGQENIIDHIVSEITNYHKAGIFTDSENTPAKIARALMDKGVRDYRAYVCEDLGTDKERITEGTLTQIARKRFSPLNVMVLIKKLSDGGIRHKEKLQPSTFRLPSHFGLPDSSFSHAKNMITKEEIRVISLAKLRLDIDSVVWDIGSGSGSIAVESALIARHGQVFAVEKDASRIIHIKQNKKKFRTENLSIIHKKAPDGLDHLPAPDAIFIGGGGKDIDEILKVCLQRIKQGGRIVVNAITLETLASASGFFKKTGAVSETISVNIARTKNVAAMHLFNAHNPVFIIAGEKA